MFDSIVYCTIFKTIGIFLSDIGEMNVGVHI